MSSIAWLMLPALRPTYLLLCVAACVDVLCGNRMCDLCLQNEYVCAGPHLLQD
jgi:hypothetical protein